MKRVRQKTAPIQWGVVQEDRLRVVSFGTLIVSLMILLLPPISFLYAPPFGWFEFWNLFFGYFIFAFGVTGGYHRQAAHQSYQAKRWFVLFVLILGSMSISNGPVLNWAAMHLLHHTFSDIPFFDPHTPSQFQGILGVLWAQGPWYLFASSFDRKTRVVDEIVKVLAPGDLKELNERIKDLGKRFDRFLEIKEGMTPENKAEAEKLHNSL